MDIHYTAIQMKGCSIVMPVFSAAETDSIPPRRIDAMNAFYTAMTDSIRAYAAALLQEMPHSRYICQGEAQQTENGNLLIRFRLSRRTAGHTAAARTLQHIWQDGLLIRQLIDR